MELIDTDVLIDVQCGFGAAADWFATDPDVGVPGFVVMELVQDARNSDEVQKALALVDGLEVVWPSEAECHTAHAAGVQRAAGAAAGTHRSAAATRGLSNRREKPL